jgi:hypothetical protein
LRPLQSRSVDRCLPKFRNEISSIPKDFISNLKSQLETQNDGCSFSDTASEVNQNVSEMLCELVFVFFIQADRVSSKGTGMVQETDAKRGYRGHLA